MARALKVWGWTGSLPVDFERPERYRRRVQARCFVAASSKAEVGRIVGCDPRNLHSLTETGNAQEIEVALAKPGQVFMRDEFNFAPGERVIVEHPHQGRYSA